ncbi:alpha-L-glutamate ligase, RimK family [Thiorhodococcus drewsii AZ1]|uniref:Alpha-L-glutamate ligase, RimK family n=1 Tax=Thiorhodococcus drewsii AZ1 TaxID=765913 RepID=G2DX05_9GAMM|nr:RimK family alpha-L-glutamate ligase [Thiorhodococcus drewsii]EGV33359.1 alpha-L-glutamate ligase, RimK family [Thiorhodococcus drewsii AZ1]
MTQPSRRIAICTDDPGWHGARLRRAFAEHGWDSGYVSLQACRFDLTDDGDGAGLVIPGFDGLPDGAFVRGVPGGTLEQVTFHLDVLHALRRLGILVYNDARAIERSVDKCMTSFLLRTAGIPTPPTWCARDPDWIAELVERELAAGHQLVHKPLFGSQGEGLTRVRERGDLPAPDDCNGIHYLQRFIPTGDAGAHDWRVFVVGGQALAAMRRSSRDWITNVAQGASCHPAVLDAELRTLAESASAALGMAYTGVDILRDREGRAWVIEVNGVPAWKGLQQVCGLDLAEVLVSDMLRRIHENRVMEAVS